MIYHGTSGFCHAGGYFKDTIIVVPDESILEATPLPSGPEHMPDIGMPDIDLEDF